MDREKAKSIYRLLKLNEHTIKPFYSVEFSLQNDIPLINFHQWANGKDFVGGCLIRRNNRTAYWLLFLLWNEEIGYYLVLFPENKSGPIAEIHEVEQYPPGEILKWEYRPIKHDERNEARKEYFKKYFYDIQVTISVPENANDLVGFLDELFSLAEIRLKADELDPDVPEYRDSFPEGKLKEMMHRFKERNLAVIGLAKKIALQKNGKLKCQVCGFDFAETYGPIGDGFIEAHHTVPICDLSDSGEDTSLDEISLVQRSQQIGIVMTKCLKDWENDFS